MRNFLKPLAAILALGAGPAFAEPAALTPRAGWTTDLTLYLFAPVSTKGTSTVAGIGAEVDLNLREALDVLDFTLSGRLEAWNGNWAIIVDANYLGISEEQGVTLPGPVGAGLNVAVDVTQSWIGILGAVRVASGQLGSRQPYSIDLQAGARYNRLKQTVSLAGPVTTRSFGGSETWWEPVIAGRAVWGISDRWAGGILVDIGGFGVGGNDLAWSTTLAFDYEFNNSTSLKLGYRYYSIDYSTTKPDGTFAYDVRQHGPLIGVSFKF